MKESPEILAISNMLECPLGRSITYVLSCIGTAVATVLAAAKLSRAAVVVATGAYILTIVSSNVIILKCGTSLIRTINGSLRNSSAPTRTVAGSASEPSVSRGDGSRRNSPAAAKKKQKPNNLLAAGKKIAIAMSVCVISGILCPLFLMFAIFSGYGVAAPLLFFGIPM